MLGNCNCESSSSILAGFQLAGTNPGVDPITILYDNNGNRKRVLDGATTLRAYTWDWSNRLTSVDIDSVTTDYEYLGDDTRLSQTTSAGTTDYLVERQSGLTQVVDDGSRSSSSPYTSQLIPNSSMSVAILSRLQFCVANHKG